MDIAEFTEIESGKRNDRPELEKALVATITLRRFVAGSGRRKRLVVVTQSLSPRGWDFCGQFASSSLED